MGWVWDRVEHKKKIRMCTGTVSMSVAFSLLSYGDLCAVLENKNENSEPAILYNCSGLL